jgi:hypothetical protein
VVAAQDAASTQQGIPAHPFIGGILAVLLLEIQTLSTTDGQQKNFRLGSARAWQSSRAYAKKIVSFVSATLPPSSEVSEAASSEQQQRPQATQAFYFMWFVGGGRERDHVLLGWDRSQILARVPHYGPTPPLTSTVTVVIS